VRTPLDAFRSFPALMTVFVFVNASASADDGSFSEVARGRYLTTVGDCVACHTKDGGTPFAGGRAISTPFGTIYSPNITPDRETGIGAWTNDDFYRAMHLGIGRNGERLFPAFPYPYFTKLARDDVLAIRAFLSTLDPVKNSRTPNDFIWPLNYRVFMRGWNWMFFEPGTFKPALGKSAEWNRGAYLVEGAAHCGACHTPKNIAGADKDDKQLTGNRLQNWFAPSLANDARQGLGDWSIDDISEYLKTGRNRHSGATGLMAEVVVNSTSKMRLEDLRAIAVYLKDITSQQTDLADTPSEGVMRAGAAIFNDSCAACHQITGIGVPRMFPPLAGNASVQSSDPTSVLRAILEGAQTAPTEARPTPSAMPAYDWKLNDEQIAAVATFVRNHWGNSASVVSADQVQSLRNSLRTKGH
jgi:mono/diheme cytochrome c family protein